MDRWFSTEIRWNPIGIHYTIVWECTVIIWWKFAVFWWFFWLWHIICPLKLDWLKKTPDLAFSDIAFKNLQRWASESKKQKSWSFEKFGSQIIWTFGWIMDHKKKTLLYIWWATGKIVLRSRKTGFSCATSGVFIPSGWKLVSRWFLDTCYEKRKKNLQNLKI